MSWDNGNQVEGTNFDFYMTNESVSYTFEIKYTEYGFGKADLKKEKGKYKKNYQGISAKAKELHPIQHRSKEGFG